ncbi:MAG: type ISP restriction/modification enzyme [Mariprofundaceae bacterium]
MTARVFHAHLWGGREEKYAALAAHDVSDIKWTEIEPEKPFYLFIPQDKGAWKEYQQGWSLPDIFPVNVLGFQTHRDHFAVAFTREEMAARVADMRNPALTDEQLRAKYNLGKWNVSEGRKIIERFGARPIQECLYRPFDTRSCYYAPIVMDRPRRELMDHVAGRENLCLNVCRQTKAADWRHAVVSDRPSPAVFVEIKDGSTVMPLYVYPSDSEAQGDLLAAREKQPNLAPAFIEAVCDKLGLPFDAAGHRGIHLACAAQRKDGTWNPEDLFCYAYAVFHSPNYRRRYAEYLKIDFPRLPLTSDAALFFRLADLGEALVRLHLMRSEVLDDFITRFPHSGGNAVEKVQYRDGAVWINKDQCFAGVDEADWAFRIGGYQPLQKWLKDRKGRTLSFEDIEHWQRIVVAIHETRRLMAEIDAVVPAWPLP